MGVGFGMLGFQDLSFGISEWKESPVCFRASVVEFWVVSLLFVATSFPSAGR